MPPPPQPFDAETYLAWHESIFPRDAPVRDRLATLRADLLDSSRNQLRALSLALISAADHCRGEYELAVRTPTEYDIPLHAARRGDPNSPAYDLLFKSEASIINKLWRKNRNPPSEVHLGNLGDHIRDLVRTDITATTLDSARFMAERMNVLPGHILTGRARKGFEEHVAFVRFEPEMKMESGYFAYHGEVRFHTGLVVEVQIDSELMRQWRRLSHAHYERARTTGMQKHEFNSKESRLVSLGHLLHVAECELQQLAEEFRA